MDTIKNYNSSTPRLILPKYRSAHFTAYDASRYNNSSTNAQYSSNNN